MKIKIILSIMGIVFIIGLALFGTAIKERVLKGMIKDIPEYECEKGVCVSCFIEGNACSCGKDMCKCGNISVSKDKCKLYR